MGTIAHSAISRKPLAGRPTPTPPEDVSELYAIFAPGVRAAEVPAPRALPASWWEGSGWISTWVATPQTEQLAHG